VRKAAFSGADDNVGWLGRFRLGGRWMGSPSLPGELVAAIRHCGRGVLSLLACLFCARLRIPTISHVQPSGRPAILLFAACSSCLSFTSLLLILLRSGFFHADNMYTLARWFVALAVVPPDIGTTCACISTFLFIPACYAATVHATVWLPSSLKSPSCSCSSYSTEHAPTLLQ